MQVFALFSSTFFAPMNTKNSYNNSHQIATGQRENYKQQWWLVKVSHQNVKEKRTKTAFTVDAKVIF